jgi:hypothetical protein
VPSEDEEKRTKAKDDERVADQDLRMSHLHRIDATSRETKRLTEGNFTLADAGISPDGTEIAAVRRPTPKADDGSGSDIVLIPAEGGAPRVLFENSGTDTSPRFSPDGKTIAFLTRDGKLPRSGTNTSPSSRAGRSPTKLPGRPVSGSDLWSKDGLIFFTATVGVRAVLPVSPRPAPQRLGNSAPSWSLRRHASDGASLASCARIRVAERCLPPVARCERRGHCLRNVSPPRAWPQRSRHAAPRSR